MCYYIVFPLWIDRILSRTKKKEEEEEEEEKSKEKKEKSHNDFVKWWNLEETYLGKWETYFPFGECYFIYSVHISQPNINHYTSTTIHTIFMCMFHSILFICVDEKRRKKNILKTFFMSNGGTYARNILMFCHLYYS